MSGFETWWYQEGSGIKPILIDDMESHAERISKIAWSNGEDKSKQQNAKLIKALKNIKKITLESDEFTMKTDNHGCYLIARQALEESK